MQTITKDLSQIRRFSDALHYAILDASLEKSKQLVFYYDADVILSSITGLTLGQALPVAADLRLAVRALLGMKALGTVQLLRPHLLEVDNFIQSLPKNRRMLQADFRLMITHHLSSWNLQRFINGLRRIRELHSRPQRERLVSRLLEQEGFDAFVKAELLFGGTWLERLRRCIHLDVFHFPATHLEDTIDTAAPLVDGFFEILEHHRPHEQPNNLMDAMALASLGRMLRDGHRSEPRFYTETRIVQDVLGDPGTLALLTSESSEAYGSVLRTSEYFVMRCSFHPLAFKAAGETTDSEEVTFDKLRALSEELREVLGNSSDEHSLTALLNRPFIEDLPLGQSIEKFFRLGFVRSTLFNWEGRENLDEVFPGLRSVFTDYVLVDSTRQHFDDAVAEARKQIAAAVAAFRRLRDRFDKVFFAVKERRKECSGNVPELALDIGLGRWGLEHDLLRQESVAEWIGAVVTHPEATLVRLAGELAGTVDARGLKRSDVQKTMTQLWFLGLVSLIEERWPAWRKCMLEDDPFEVLYLVSRVRRQWDDGGTAPNWAPVNEALDRARELCAKQCPGHQMGMRLMGLAHVSYWAWKVYDISRTGDDREGEATANGYLSESFDSAWRARDLLIDQEIAWAFATNHCAYVGHLAGIRPDDTEECFRVLNGALRRYKGHYRFADTLALPLTKSAENKVRQYGGTEQFLEEAPRAVHQRACSELRAARTLLERAEPYFGDVEVVEHYGKVLRFLGRLGCEAMRKAKKRNPRNPAAK